MGELLTKELDDSLRHRFQEVMTSWLAVHSEMTQAELVLLEWELHRPHPVPAELEVNLYRLRAEGQRLWSEVLQAEPRIAFGAARVG